MPIPFDAEKLGKIFGSGLLIYAAPQLLSGALNEWLLTISVKEICTWVASDKALWDEIAPEWQGKLKTWGPRMGDMKWLTPEWMILECRKQNPAICSLFLSWAEAGVWLQKNLENLKKELHSPVMEKPVEDTIASEK